MEVMIDLKLSRALTNTEIQILGKYLEYNWTTELSAEEKEELEKKNPDFKSLLYYGDNSCLCVYPNQPDTLRLYDFDTDSDNHLEAWLDLYIHKHFNEWGVLVNGVVDIWGECEESSGCVTYKDSVYTWSSYAALRRKITYLEKIIDSLPSEGKKYWEAAEALYKI
jgi:hypothetical protein